MDQTSSKEVRDFHMPEENLRTLHPPGEAYLYFPPNDECKYTLGKHKFRRIFDGQVQLDHEDEQHINTFLDQIKKNQVELNKNVWTDPQIIRFLQANQFKYKETLQAMIDYDAWLHTLPPKFTDTTQQFLNSGIIYIQGRDCRYRPIIVLNAYKIDLKAMSLDLCLQGLVFFLEVVRHTMLLPGQIENWVIIMDLNYTSVGLPIGALKSVMGFLQNNYRSRLYKMYLVNTSMAISLIWKTIKPFLEENTGQKIIFCKDVQQFKYSQKCPEMKIHINPKQIEQKYGGLATNKEVGHCWPPLLLNTDIQLESEPTKLTSKELYKILFEQGKLNNNKVFHDYIV